MLINNSRSRPLLNTSTDWQSDGKLVGAGGHVLEADTPLDQVQAMLPNNGQEPKETVVYVNGILTDVELQSHNMQELANTGRRVVGVHNATKGFLRDFAQCAGDKLDYSGANNGAVDTLADLIEKNIDNPHPPHIVGHSQGALVVSRAIAKAKQDLTDGGLTQVAVEQKLSAFPVTTIGGASYTFAPGPNYAHIVNLCDAVPMLFGAAPTSLLSDSVPVETFASQNLPSNLPPVSGGLVNYLARAGEQLAHGCEEHYFKHLSLRAS